jgi:hypothetical protein
MQLVTLGVGAQNSPRYAPAGLLVSHAALRVMIDGGPGAVPRGKLDAWLVTDEQAELIGDIRRLARRWNLVPRAITFARDGLRIARRPVIHTRHPTYGYRIEAGGRRVVWAPEFLTFPSWARGADVMFAEAAGWNRPIRFAGRAGGHLDAVSVALAARAHGVKRLVFAHIGRPTLRALERHQKPPFGEFAVDGQRFTVPSGRKPARRSRPARSTEPRGSRSARADPDRRPGRSRSPRRRRAWRQRETSSPRRLPGVSSRR